MKMNSIRKKVMIVFALALISTLLYTACGSTEKTPSGDGGDDAGKLSGTVTVSGSTSVQPLAQDLADVFNETQPDVVVEIQGGGSSQGIKDVSDGISAIGNSSRDLKEEEKSLGLTEHIIAYDGIAVVAHPSNPVSNLTKDQLQKIFKGEITNWKDVGGNDAQILVVTREDGSGTRSAFEELLKLQETKDGKTVSYMKSDALVADSNGAVKANVSSKTDAIGYTSLGYVDDTLKKVSVDGVECTVENVKNKNYAISRPFLMLTKGELAPEVQAFLDFIKGDKGQEVVGEKYITIK
ncbi:MAG: phosphate ABC transporter substrate-binding protein [Clostridiaceae bacterium]